MSLKLGRRPCAHGERTSSSKKCENPNRIEGERTAHDRPGSRTKAICHFAPLRPSKTKHKSLKLGWRRLRSRREVHQPPLADLV